MLKLEIIRFEAQDVITHSVSPGPCGCTKKCLEYMITENRHASSCHCKEPERPVYWHKVDNS